MNYSIDARQFVPQYLLDESEYGDLVDLLSIIFSDVQDLIDNFDTIVDIDNCPEIFIPKLSALLDYRCPSTKFPVSAQREVVKRMIHAYRSRGKDSDILNAVKYGYHENYVGGTLMYPDYELFENPALIIYPVDNLFKHNISKHSGKDKFADSERWRDGVVIIRANYLDDNIRNAIKKIVPAGIKFCFDLVYNAAGEGDSKGEYDEITYGEWTLCEYYKIEYNIRIKNVIEANMFSQSSLGRKLRSGRQLLFNDYEIEKLFGATFLDMIKPSLSGTSLIHDITQYVINSIEHEITYRGIPDHSVDSFFDGKYGRSGTRTGIIDALVKDYIIPRDFMYNVVEVADMKVGSQLTFYNPPVEVIIST